MSKRAKEREVMIRRNDDKRVVERGEGKGGFSNLESSDPLQVSSNPKHSLRLLPLLPSLSRLYGAVAACFCRGLPRLHSWPAKTRTQHGEGKRESWEGGKGRRRRMRSKDRSRIIFWGFHNTLTIRKYHNTVSSNKRDERIK